MMYKKILNSILEEFSFNKSEAAELFIDIEHPDYQKNNKAILELKQHYNTFSEEYIKFLEKYHCFNLGWNRFFVCYVELKGDLECSLSSTSKKISEMMSIDYNKIFPICVDLNEEPIFLNSSGQVIKFIGSVITSKPEEWQTYCTEENLANGLDVAYLDYYDDFADGYREYRVLGNTFGQFMDECIFGERYLEFSEEDVFYHYIKQLKNKLGLKDTYKTKYFADGSAHYSIGKQIEDQLKNCDEGIIDEFEFKIVQ